MRPGEESVLDILQSRLDSCRHLNAKLTVEVDEKEEKLKKIRALWVEVRQEINSKAAREMDELLKS